MTIVARVTLSQDDYPLGAMGDKSAHVRVNRVLSSEGSATQYFWAPTADHHALEASLVEEEVDQLQVIETTPDYRLYRATWAVDRDPFTAIVHEYDLDVLYGTVREDRWAFQLSLVDGTHLRAVQQHCLESKEMELAVQEVFIPNRRSAFEVELTECQREALLAAYEEGYFEIPRKTTMVELAELFDVSDQAVSERLRRAQSRLIRASMAVDDS